MSHLDSNIKGIVGLMLFMVIWEFPRLLGLLWRFL